MNNGPPTKDRYPGYFKSTCVVNGREVVRFYPIKDILPMLYKEKDNALQKVLSKQTN